MSSMTGCHFGSVYSGMTGNSGLSIAASHRVFGWHSMAKLLLLSGLAVMAGTANATLPGSRDDGGSEVAYRVSTKSAAAVHWAKTVR